MHDLRLRLIVKKHCKRKKYITYNTHMYNSNHVMMIMNEWKDMTRFLMYTQIIMLRTSNLWILIYYFWVFFHAFVCIFFIVLKLFSSFEQAEDQYVNDIWRLVTEPMKHSDKKWWHQKLPNVNVYVWHQNKG